MGSHDPKGFHVCGPTSVKSGVLENIFTSKMALPSSFLSSFLICI